METTSWSRNHQVPQYIRAYRHIQQDASGGVSKLIYITGANLPHASPAGIVLGGECCRGLGFSCNLLWSENGHLLQ